MKNKLNRMLRRNRQKRDNREQSSKYLRKNKKLRKYQTKTKWDYKQWKRLRNKSNKMTIDVYCKFNKIRIDKDKFNINLYED